jgi:hypothetical protein
MKYENAIEILQDEIIYLNGLNLQYMQDQTCGWHPKKSLISDNLQKIDELRQAQSLLNSENELAVSNAKH